MEYERCSLVKENDILETEKLLLNKKTTTTKFLLNLGKKSDSSLPNKSKILLKCEKRVKKLVKEDKIKALIFLEFEMKLFNRNKNLPEIEE